MRTMSNGVKMGFLLASVEASAFGGLGGLVLMDQIGADDGSSIDTSNVAACQYFEAAYSIYSIAAIDDFDNSAGTIAGEVHAVVTGWNGYASIDGVTGIQINFYDAMEDAAANLVGYASSDHAVAVSGTWGGVGGDLCVATGSWAVNAGTALVAAIPSNEFATNGQTGIALSFLGDGAMWQANPGGGFGMPNNWQPYAGSLAYRVLVFDEDCNNNGVLDEDEIAANPLLDCNTNTLLDSCEIAWGIADDCNANGILDECDIADGTSNDCSGNGVPDECEPDCNTNNVPDSCDIVDGTSNDCNANSIPDECDLANGTSADCNANGIPDECDIAGGLTEDCNFNGIPDECDIANGTSEDADGNGIPDECGIPCDSVAAVLPPPDGVGSRFGFSMIAQDQRLAIRCEGQGEVGVESVVVMNRSTLAIESILDVPTANSSAPSLGNSVAMGDGWIAAATFDGRVYTYAFTAGGWLGGPVLDRPGGSSDETLFGFTVGGHGNRLAVGEITSTTGEIDRVHAYEWDQGVWRHTQVIDAECYSSQPWFGASIVMEADWLFIANPLANTEYGNQTGDVHVYQHDGSEWVPTQVLLPEHHAQEDDGFFGTHMAINGELLVVAAQFRGDGGRGNGRVYVYRHNNGAWELINSLVSPDGENPSGFGHSVAIDGTRLAIGSWSYYSSEQGIVYIYDVPDTGSPLLRSTMTTEGDEIEYAYASSMAFLSDGLVVGRPWFNDGSGVCDVLHLPSDNAFLDCNLNALCDANDLLNGTSSDCDNNGRPDECDIADGTQADLDHDGVPDSCEPDCNDDGWPDDHELAMGWAEDCNDNGVPDSCDIAFGPSTDTNGDGVPDECVPGYVVTVTADGSGQFTDLQAAVAFAPNGSLVEVGPGEYAGPIVFGGKAMTVRSTAGRDATIINGSTGCVLFIAGESSDSILEGFTLRGGSLARGGGIMIESASPTIRSCRVELCVAWQGGGVSVNGGSPTLDNVIIDDNTAGEGGGIRVLDGTLTLSGCDITNNLATHGGGGVFLAAGGNELPTMSATDCMIAGNTSMGDTPYTGGGGVLIGDGQADLNACDLEENSAVLGGGILAFANASVAFTNGHFVSNLASTTGGGIAVVLAGDPLIEVGESWFCLNHPNDITGTWSDLGENIFDADCNENGICDLTDIIDGTSTDCNENLIPDDCEAEDCNLNGINDVCDIASGDSSDLNGDGIPDECQDCNENGWPDFVDIDFGTSEDCNENGIPDECDIDDGTSIDCNDNGVPDDCDIASGASNDINDNGIPDECDFDCNANGTPDDWDIAQGLSGDCNGNTIPDECDIADGNSVDGNSNGVPDECEPGWVVTVGPGGFDSIQSAIDAALDGNIIEVQPGTWTGSVDLTGRVLEVRSSDGAAVTTIAGDGSGSVVLVGAESEVEIVGFGISGGQAERGGGLLLFGGAATIQNCIIEMNTAENGGGIGVVGGALTIESCEIRWNTAILGGGGLYQTGGFLLVIDTIVLENDGGTTGGGLSVFNGDCVVLDSWFGGNIASIGGGINAANQAITVQNTTFVGNTGELSAGGFQGGNGPGQASDIIDSAFCENTTTDILGHWNDVGTNHFSDDCDGNGRCDAEELAAGDANDCDGNGQPDVCDADCNNNGLADSCDIANGTSEDVDGNGVPDECQDDCDANGIPDKWELVEGAPDCNENGLLDVCDIDMGISGDCDLNAIPDECDIAGGAPDCDDDGVIDTCNADWNDCDGNGVYDVCDIAGGAPDCDLDGLIDTCNADWDDCDDNGVYDACDIAGPDGDDCNSNGILDSCDIANGAPDYNNNGIPDECEPDCNDNGIPDFLDIEYGFSEDCNLNTIPDECDIENGTSEDANGDGIPDECDCLDADGDGLVGATELLLVLKQWGVCDTCEADFDLDGIVGVNDLLMVVSAFGPCE